jgi:nicotinamidase-related amidase
MKKLKFVLFILSINCLTVNNILAQGKFLLIVDVQAKFYENTKIESPANEMVQQINQVITKVEPQNVVYIKATGKNLSISFKGIKTTPMFPAPDLDSKLKIVSSNIFTKVEGDAFTVDSLNKFLTDNGAKEIIIVGLLAEKCVYNTAVGGKEKGNDVYIIPEAIISKSKEEKEKAFKKLTEKGVKILPISELSNAS